MVATIIGDGSKDLVEVTVDTDGPKGNATGAVVATGGHPFWVENKHAWLDASKLEPGDQIHTPAGEQLTILSVRHWTALRRVHNLTVEDIHTYYVLAVRS